MSGSYVIRTVALILATVFTIRHCSAQSSGYVVTERGADYKILQKTTVENGTNRVHSYTELATGMNYTNSQGQWIEAQEQITLLPTGGAAATNGRHQVYFPADIYNGVLEVVTPDGRHLQSRPLGVSYDDGSNTVFIATLTNAIGQLVGSNQVVYPNAFAGIKADLVMTYRRGGFESDLVFRQQPPAPGDYNLDPDYSTLQLVTEFFNTTDPEQIPAASDEWYGLDDSTLQFGQLNMIQGKAFAMNPTRTNAVPPPAAANAAVPVYKRWLHLDNRTFLVEEVPVEDVADDLAALPLTASISKPASSKVKLAAYQRVLPPTHSVMADTNQMLLASADFSKKPGVVLDYYTTIDSDQTDFTFTNGGTYYISGSFIISGTLTFEGGAVIKFSGASIDVYSPYLTSVINCVAAVDQPTILTAVDDDSVGAVIDGSTGMPSGYYGNPYLHDYDPVTSGRSLSNLRICYANSAISIATLKFILMDSQILNCYSIFLNGSPAGYRIYPYSFYNVLFDHIQYGFPAGGSFIDLENSTFNDFYYVFYDRAIGKVTATNCIFANCNYVHYNPYGTTSGTYIGQTNGFYNALPFGANTVTNTSSPFETAGTGDCYLTNGITFRDAGTTSINPGLLAEIQNMTTYTPQDGKRADNDGMPDLGYHYPIPGYITNGLVAYWRLNDGAGSTAVDSVAGNNLTLHGSTAPTWGSAYLTFNGSDQYGDAGNPSALDITGDITICAWVNSASFPTGSDLQVPVEKGLDNYNEGYFMRFMPSSTLEGGSYDDSTEYDDSVPNLNLTGQWYFIAVTYHANYWNIYINGCDITDHYAVYGALHTTAPLYVGAASIIYPTGSPVSITRFFNGSIHDVGIYNRALSASEVKHNFLNTEFNSNVSVPDLLYYKMTAAEALQASQFDITLTDYSTSGAHTGHGQADFANLYNPTIRQYWLFYPNTISLTEALHFNGQNTILYVTNSSTAFDFTSNPFTVNMWVWAYTGGGYLIQNGGITNGWFIREDGSESVIFGSAIPGAVSSISTGTGQLNTSLLEMLTCVWDGTHASIYVNGVAEASGSLAAPAPSAYSLMLGIDGAGANYFDGDIWLPQIWGSALTATDIANLYFQQVRGVPWP